MYHFKHFSSSLLIFLRGSGQPAQGYLRVVQRAGLSLWVAGVRELEEGGSHLCVSEEAPHLHSLLALSPEGLCRDPAERVLQPLLLGNFKQGQEGVWNLATLPSETWRWGLGVL